MTSFREWMNAHAGLAGGIVIVVVAAAGVFIFHSAGRSQVPLPTFQTTAYYSSDDGATFFTDKINLPTPFDKDGHPAYGAHVFSADNGQHRWVGYLEKSGNTFTAYVKKPGEADWVPIMSQAGMKVLTVKPHAGMGTEQVQEFYP